MPSLTIVAPYGQQNPTVAVSRLSDVDLEEGQPEMYGYAIATDVTTADVGGATRTLGLTLTPRFLDGYTTPALREAFFENVYRGKIDTQYPGLCTYTYSDL